MLNFLEIWPYMLINVMYIYKKNMYRTSNISGTLTMDVIKILIEFQFWTLIVQMLILC